MYLIYNLKYISNEEYVYRNLITKSILVPRTCLRKSVLAVNALEAPCNIDKFRVFKSKWKQFPKRLKCFC